MAKKTAVPTLADALAATEVLTAFLATQDGAENAEDDDAEVEVLDREETEALGIKELRELAKENGIDEKKKADILSAMDEKGLFGEEEDEEEDEDEEDDDDDEDAEEEGFDRDELEDMDLKALRKLAKSDEGGAHDADAVKGLDKDDLIDLITGEGDEDDDEDEEDDDDEEEDGDEDDDDDETEELDEDALREMSVKELTDLAKELEVKVPAKTLKAAKTLKGKKQETALKDAYVDTILASGDEEE